MQWVHSLDGLVSHLGGWTEAKLEEVAQQERQIEKEKAERQDALMHNVELDSGPINHRKLANVR
jgi:hypothetical protein